MKRKNDNQKEVKKIIKKQLSRVEVTKKSHLWFFHTYLSGHVEYPIADFHKEIFEITENDQMKLAAICSFRESGKSTLISLSFPIWAILGRLEKKFVVIISQTAEQAKTHFRNLKIELETNELLKRDLGPFQELRDEWNACSLVIPRYGAKIVALSKEQSFRGIKYGSHRPDLIIADDVENSDSVKTQESRDNTYNWFTSEVLPLGSRNTKIVIVGNLLHQDSLLKRLENGMKEGTRSGIFRRYPLLDENDKINWPGKFPDAKSIEEERLKIGNIFAWYREYLLRIIDEREPVIDKRWIQYYDELPLILRNQGYSFATGVDLAISERDTADFTSLVTAKVIGYGKNQKIFILPNPVNEKLKFSQIIEKAENICKMHEGKSANKFYIEEVMLQGFMTQQLREKSIEAVGVPIRGKDKRTRLELSANPVFEGKVLFPRHGCEGLIDQALNFGVAKNDDLVDALTTLILGIIDNPPHNYPQVMFVKHNFYDRLSTNRRGGWGPGITSSIEFTDSGIIRRY